MVGLTKNKFSSWSKDLKINGNPQADAADGLACALCHCFTSKVTKAMGAGVATQGSVHGRFQREK